jgi:DNA adenine methylase
MSLKVFKWPGSKQPHLSKLLPLIPQGGQPYCEPYAGSLAVLLARKPAPSEIVNDADHTLVNFYKVIQDKQTFKKLYRLLVQTPYSRAEFVRAMEVLKQHISNHTPNQLSTPSVELAWAFFVFYNQRMPGRFHLAHTNWAVSKTSVSTVSFQRFIKRIPQLRQRLKEVHFDCIDALSFIKRWDSPATVMYIDPPYVNLDNYYLPLANNIEHHQQLVDIVLSCKSAIVISGYDHPVYDKLMEHGWQKIQFQTITQMSNTKGEGQRKLKLQRVECVWRNPKAVAATTHNLSLFD